jgi:hypothetical protein
MVREKTNLRVKWLDHGREPQCAPNPDYPDGKDVDMSDGRKCCETALPYPAKRCGIYIVRCERCGLTAGITTAGRPDDPRSVKMRCKPNA